FTHRPAVSALPRRGCGQHRPRSSAAPDHLAPPTIGENGIADPAGDKPELIQGDDISKRSGDRAQAPVLRQEVEARITVRTVEIFLRGKRVASHLRSTLPHRPTTIADHMPSSHRRYRDWTHERIRRDAAKVGPDADTLIEVILRSRPHPEQGFRSAIGVLGLVKRYGAERVDAACARALLLNARSYKSVAAILKNGTDKAASATPDAPILLHPNIRGRGYYN
ncbi:MAG: hypothetical protein ACRD9W_15270, partial [Terriglobia bacterium]